MSAGRRPRIGFKNWLKGQQINPAKVSPEELAVWKRSYEDAMARAAAGPDVDDLKREYFRPALEYYISARFAAVSGFNPMAGVLFHHAIELGPDRVDEVQLWRRLGRAAAIRYDGIGLWDAMQRAIEPAGPGFSSCAPC